MTVNAATASRRSLGTANPSLDETGALVIGGDYRGLGIVRSLGRRGIPVWVLADHHSIAGMSRYARRSMPFPPGGEREQIDFLLRLGERHELDGWALLPTGDEAAALIAHHWEVLNQKFRLTTPSWEVMKWGYDKRLTYSLAADLGIEHPWTRWVGGRSEMSALDCPFPAILKPAYKKNDNRFTYNKAWPVRDRHSLLARYDEACALVGPDAIMVQELIPGGGETQFSFAALCQDGRPVATVVARRWRQYPPDFGRSSSYVETVDCPEIEEPSRRLIEAIRLTGLVEIEFKRDPRNGSYKLLDINPRVWGWHTIGERASVDFSHLLWRMIHGQSLQEQRVPVGVRWVRLVTDLPAVALEIRAGTLSLPDYLRSLRGPLECAILAPDDPLPALVEVPLLCRLAWRRRAIV